MLFRSNKKCKLSIEGKPSELVFLFARTFAQNERLSEMVGAAVGAVDQMTEEEKHDLGECTSLNLGDD